MIYTHQNENFTLFMMGFTMHEKKTPVPPNAGSNKGHEFRYIYSIQREVIKEFESLKLYYAHLDTFVQSYDIASEALNNFKKIHYMY